LGKTFRVRKPNSTTLVIQFPLVEDVSENVKVIALSRKFLRSVSIVLLMGKGSYADHVPGCACLNNRMHLRLTSKLRPLKLQAAIDRLGMTIEAVTDRDLMLLRAQAPLKKTEQCLSFLAEVLMSPCFLASEVAKEKTGQKLEYDRVRQDPMTASVADAWEVTFPDSPLGHPVTGYPETIDKLKSSMLEAFDSDVRKGARIVIGIVGAQDDEILVDYAKSALTEINTAGHVEALRPGSRKDFNVATRRLNAKQTTYSVNIVTSGMASASFPALLLIEDYLGSDRHYMGVLFNELREKRGLTYFAQSRLYAFKDCGLLMAFAGAEHEKVLEAAGLMLDCMLKLREKPIDNGELKQLKTFHRQVMGITLETPSQAATWLAQNAFRGGTVDFESYMAEVDSVSSEVIRTTAERFLTPQSMTVSVAGKPPDERSLKALLEEKVQ
jgi:zinc protease